LSPSASLSPGPPPTVDLNSENNPPDAGTGVSLTPDLYFVGTESDGYSLEYEIQIDTRITFDSQTP
jgi:hypothetical protein